MAARSRPAAPKKSPAKKAAPKKAAPATTTAPARRAGEIRHWLVKTEPEVFSFDDLVASKGRTTFWSGVRNYQARNMMRDEMKIGDRVIIYHSNAEPSAAVGVAEVAREGYPDHTQFDPADDHFDPEADPAQPRWYMVDVRAVQRLARPLSLAELREVPTLTGMELLRKGSRLSVQPVRPEEFDTILKLGGVSPL